MAASLTSKRTERKNCLFIFYLENVVETLGDGGDNFLLAKFNLTVLKDCIEFGTLFATHFFNNSTFFA